MVINAPSIRHVINPQDEATQIAQSLPPGYREQFLAAVQAGRSPRDALNFTYGGSPGQLAALRIPAAQGPLAQAALQQAAGGAGGAQSTAFQSAPGNVGALGQQQQQAFDAANAANESRYQSILSGFGTRESALRSAFAQQSSLLAGQGKTAAADITRRFVGERSRGMQGLVSAGLYGSTVAPTMGIAYQRAESQEQGRLQESLRAQQAGLAGQQAQALSDLAGERLAFQERRTDAYPNQAAFLNLSQQAGQAGVGAAGQPAAFNSSAPRNFTQGLTLERMAAAKAEEDEKLRRARQGLVR